MDKITGNLNKEMSLFMTDLENTERALNLFKDSVNKLKRRLKIIKLQSELLKIEQDGKREVINNFVYRDTPEISGTITLADGSLLALKNFFENP